MSNGVMESGNQGSPSLNGGSGAGGDTFDVGAAVKAAFERPTSTMFAGAGLMSAEAEVTPPADAATSKAVPDGTEASTSSDPSDVPESEGEGSESESEGEAEEEGQPATKVAKATHKGKALDVPEDATFQVKVDGKNEAVSLSDLKKNYAGKVAYDKKFSELDVQRKAFRKDVQYVDNRLKDIFNTAKTNPMLAFKKVAKMAGLNGTEAIQNYFEQATKLKGEWETLTPEQRQFLLDREELETEKSDLEAQKKGAKATETAEETAAYMGEVLKKHGIDVPTFEAALKELEGAQKEGRFSFEGMSDKQATDSVVSFIRMDRLYARTGEVLKGAFPSRAKDTRLLKAVVAEVDDSFTDAEIREVMKAIVGKPVSTKQAAPAPAKGKPTPSVPSKVDSTKEERVFRPGASGLLEGL